MAQDKSVSITGVIVAEIFIFIVSVAGGLVGNYYLFSAKKFVFDSNSIAITVILFLGLSLFFILSRTMKDKDAKLKGKNAMENQHFASLKELDKNFKHCKFTDLKNLSIQGVPFTS